MNMRYIDKSDCCKAFDRYLINSRPLAWNEFDDNIKLILHQHLYYEQGGLCIYCQQKLLPKTEKESNAHIRSHIEHIRPRSSYPYLTFDYCNLSVSCEGFDCEILKTNQQPKKELKLIRMREKVVKDIERNGPYEKHEKQLPPFYSMLLQLGLL